ncbi:putative dNA primase TraC (plasmid) [Escherichia coli]|nr:putative dNA primase TraC [Escherichia coli]
MTKTGKKVAHIAASWTADLPAGTGIIAARMIRRSTGPSPAENRQIPAQGFT